MNVGDRVVVVYDGQTRHGTVVYVWTKRFVGAYDILFDGDKAPLFMHPDDFVSIAKEV
jgi:hypothetical protein